MRCRDALACSTAYVDGELDERRSRAVRGHLRTCATCGEAFAAEVAVRSAAAALAPIDPPESLWSNIEAAMAADEVVEARRSPFGLRVLCAFDRVRRHLLVGAVVTAAAVLVALWLTPRAPTVALLAPAAPPPVAVATPAEVPPEGAGPAAAAAAIGVEDAMAAELAAAVAHHAAIVDELTLAVSANREGWSARERTRFDRAAAAARAEVAAARAAIGAPGGDAAVLAAYRRQIALLTVALGQGRAVVALEGGR